MKLLVTGHAEDGSAIFSQAGAPARETSKDSFELWSTQGEIVVPDPTDAAAPATIGYFPAAGETTFKIVSVPGRAARARTGPAALQIPDELARHFDRDDPEMHTTDTLDYVVVLSGTADLELDDGRKESVRGGDCVVQRGTRHAWRVTSEEPLVLAATLIGARRRGSERADDEDGGGIRGPGDFGCQASPSPLLSRPRDIRARGPVRLPGAADRHDRPARRIRSDGR